MCSEELLVKIGAKVTRHPKHVPFQLAEVAVTRNLFAAILDHIERSTGSRWVRRIGAYGSQNN
jgi:hypothetical protein